MRSRPDILVLGAGGVLGEAWMAGVLAGMEDAHGIAFSDCDYVVGTSAGAVLAAAITSGTGPRRPPITEADAVRADDDAMEALEWVRRVGLDLTAALTGPWIRLGMALSAPAGARLRSGLLRVLTPGTETHAQIRDAVREMKPRFDGRLRVTAVKRSTGRRIVFGSPGAPSAIVGDAVAASCAMPPRFAPVLIAGSEYVDGGVWSPTNLDAAPAHRGAEVLCLSSTGALHGPLTAAIRIPSRARTTLEMAALRSAGVHVELLTPDRASAATLGTDPMDGAPAAAVLAAGYAQGCRS